MNFAEGREISIGDIHGCKNELEKLIQVIKPTPKDRLIFHGDYIDRGPDSKGVVDIILGLVSCFPNTICLLGNHEKYLLEWLKKDRPVINEWFLPINGGQETVKSYGFNQSIGQFFDKLYIPESHIEFFKGLQLSAETATHFFVHAGVRPNLDLESQTECDQLTIRSEFTNSDYAWEKIIVYGHDPFPCIQIEKNKIGIDTGCVFGQLLTAYDLTNEIVYSVVSHEHQPKLWETSTYAKT